MEGTYINKTCLLPSRSQQSSEGDRHITNVSIREIGIKCYNRGTYVRLLRTALCNRKIM